MQPIHLSALVGHEVTPDPIITGVSLDSRLVLPGHLFAALPGLKVDGRDFIQTAIERGAVAILAADGTVIDNPNIALVTDANPRRRFARIVAQFHGQQPATIAAVTGTNGKTSVTHFALQLWSMAGQRGAALGTMGIFSDHMTTEGSLTTPDTVSLHRDLVALTQHGVTHLAFEASSHALDQHRLDGVAVTVAGFTNLSRDHLDYHSDMAEYLAAKLRLFTELLPVGGTAVLNADIPEYPAMKAAIEAAGRKIFSYGENGADLKLLKRSLLPDGQILTIEVDGDSYNINLNLIGQFQAMNALCAAGIVIASGNDKAETLSHLSRLTPVRGRVELAGSTSNGAAVFVDYAHTPDGLETVLNALRPHTQNRLVCVFGCGGDRDRGKRPLMGEIAARLADIAIVTDDNPRTEDAAAIRADVLAASPRLQEIGDRAAAIHQAIASLQPGDVLVIAGKGHEQGQKIGTVVHPFDDVTVAREAMELLPKA